MCVCDLSAPHPDEIDELKESIYVEVVGGITARKTEKLVAEKSRNIQQLSQISLKFLHAPLRAVMERTAAEL